MCVCVCIVCVLFSFFVAGGKCNKQSFLIEPMFSTIVMNIPLYHHRGRIDDAAGTRHGFDDIDMLGIAPCCMCYAYQWKVHGSKLPKLAATKCYISLIRMGLV